MYADILWMVAKSKLPHDGKHPIVYRVSTIGLVAREFTTNHSSKIDDNV